MKISIPSPALQQFLSTLPISHPITSHRYDIAAPTSHESITLIHNKVQKQSASGRASKAPMIILLASLNTETRTPGKHRLSKTNTVDMRRGIVDNKSFADTANSCCW